MKSPLGDRAYVVDVIERARQGESAAIQQLVAHLTPGVLRAATALLGAGHPDIEDLVQESLLAVLDALPHFRGECTLLHFAVRIAARKAVSVQRRGQQVTGWLQRLWRRERAQTEAEAAVHIDEHASQRRELLRRLLRELPEEQAEVMLLRIVFDHSIEETAAYTGAPPNTVRSRLRLAKLALRQRIETDPRWTELFEVRT